jgi:hypothetical protein
MITDKVKFYTGVAMLAGFVVLLAVLFSPVFDGKNGLRYLDEVYNTISKGSAYYIPDVREDAAAYIGTPVSATISMKTEEQAEQTALLFRAGGAEAVVSGASLEINGDLGRILENTLDDADAVYHDDSEAIVSKYGYDDRQVLYNWWQSLKALKADFEDESMFDEADMMTRTNERAIEPAYNYYGIAPEAIKDKAGIVVFSLLFYIAYTLWYGFGLMYVIEGLGLKIKQMLPFRFIARWRMP